MDPKQLEATIEHQRKLVLSAAKRKGEKATKKASRAVLESWFVPGRGSPGADETRFAQTVVGYAYPPSVMPLAGLDPVHLSQLRLETHHRGKVLIVRSFGHAYRIASLQSAIEDETGDVDRLILYNSDPDLTPQQLIPRGGVFAIKEPFYKLSGDGGPCVRIDHPSDLVELSVDDPRLPNKFRLPLDSGEMTATSLKSKGNAAFKSKDYLSAIKLYSEGIRTCTESETLIKSDLLRNRSMANIHLKRFESAIEDAESALIAKELCVDDDFVKNDAKALYRAGSAAYQLRDYTKARLSFEHARKLKPDDIETEKEYRRSISRVIEQQSGKYDLDAMGAAVNKEHVKLDHASFTSRVQIRHTSDRGQGLFAKTAIKAGEIVLVEKAFVAAFASNQNASLSFVVNMNTNTCSTGSHAELLPQIVQEMLRNPARGKQLLNLYDGGYTPASEPIVDGKPVVDVFRTQQAIELNVFGCPATSTTDLLTTGEQEKDSLSSKCVGLWYMASFINHACDENASRAFIGDMMIIHATRDIAKDEEISISYSGITGDFLQTRDWMQRIWKFRCTCIICTAEAKSTEAQLEARATLIQEADNFFRAEAYWVQAPKGPPAALLAKAEQVYAALEESYEQRPFDRVARPGLRGLGLWIARAYLSQAKYGKSLDKTISAFRNHGYFIKTTRDGLTIDRSRCVAAREVVDLACYATNAYLQRGKVLHAVALQQFAKEMYKTMYGSMRDVEKRYPGLDKL